MATWRNLAVGALRLNGAKNISLGPLRGRPGPAHAFSAFSQVENER